jgi:nitroreductase
MDVIDAILSRHSVRAFKPDPVSRETILKILEVANHSPSAANTQPWQIFVAGGAVLERIRQAAIARYREGTPTTPEIPSQKEWPAALQARIDRMRTERYTLLGIDRQNREAIKENMGLNHLFFGAPVVAFLCMDRALGTWSVFDLGTLTQNIMLAALEYGLGTIPALTFVGYPDIIRQELEIPQELLIVFGIALGYEDMASPINSYRSSRRPIDEVVTFKGL